MTLDDLISSLGFDPAEITALAAQITTDDPVEAADQAYRLVRGEEDNA